MVVLTTSQFDSPQSESSSVDSSQLIGDPLPTGLTPLHALGCVVIAWLKVNRNVEWSTPERWH